MPGGREPPDHLRGGVHEGAVQAFHPGGALPHDLRDVGAGLQVAAALELEEIALGADDRPGGESLEQADGLSTGLRFGDQRPGWHPRTVSYAPSQFKGLRRRAAPSGRLRLSVDVARAFRRRSSGAMPDANAPALMPRARYDMSRTP